jgi:hypothetical protein
VVAVAVGVQRIGDRAAAADAAGLVGVAAPVVVVVCVAGVAGDVGHRAGGVVVGLGRVEVESVIVQIRLWCVRVKGTIVDGVRDQVTVRVGQIQLRENGVEVTRIGFQVKTS